MNHRASDTIWKTLTHPVSLVAIAGAVFFVLAIICMQLTGKFSHIWVSNAIVLTFIFRSRPSLTWPYFASAIYADVLAQSVLGTEALTALSTVLSHGIMLLVPVLCVKRYDNKAVTIAEMNKESGILMLSIVAGCALAGLFQGLVTTVTWHTHYITAASSWFSINLIEMISILSLGLTITKNKLAELLEPKTLIEFIATASVTIAIMLISTQYQDVRYVIIMMPMLYSAFRFGLFGTSLLCSITALTYISNIVITGASANVFSQLTPETVSYSFFLMCLTFIPAIITATLLDQREEFEKKISESEQLFRGAINHSATGMTISSLDDKWMMVNDSLCEITGYTAEELKTMTFKDITHPDDIDLGISLRKKVLKKEIPSYQVNKRYIHKSGAIVWVSLIVSAVYDKKDNPLYFFGQVIDITAKKNMEAKLQESEQRWNYALDSGGQGVWDWDLSKNRIYFSRTWKEILGFKAHEIGDGIKEWISRIHPEDKPIVTAKLDELAHCSTDDFVCEHRLKCKDGSYKWVLGRGRSIACSTENKKSLRAIGTCTDIDSLKKAEAKADKLSKRLLLAIESGKVGIWDMDLEHETLNWDERMHELFGTTAEAFTNNMDAWRECIHPDDKAKTIEDYYQALAGMKPLNIEFRIMHPKDGIKWIQTRGEVIRNSEGKPISVFGMTWDITEDKKLLQALSTQRERLHTTLKSIGDAVIVTNEYGHITFINPIAEKLIGCRSNDAIGRELYDICKIISEADGKQLENPVEKCLTIKQPTKLDEEAILINKQGIRFFIQNSTSPIILPSGDLTGCVLVLQDITMNRNLQEELKHQATHDVLTGLINRREIERKVSHVINNTRNSGNQHSLLFVDLDKFKIVNDTAGHAAGDELLKRLAAILQEAVRESDTVARLGGDEFAIMLPECDPDNAKTIADSIVHKFKNLNFQWNDKAYEIGASIGIVNFSTGALSLEEVLSRADNACYSAKNAGGNTVRVYKENASESAQYLTEIKLFPKIKEAIKYDKFKLYTQIIKPLHADSGLKPHYELLLRLPDENGNEISPNIMLKLAERHNIMPEIDLWVIKQILLTYADKIIKAGNIDVSINVSAKSIASEHFHHVVDQYLSETEVPKERIGFELREGVFLQDLDTSQKFLRILEKHGCFISVDNFGKGLSTFSHIKNFRKLYIKIDGSFIKEIGSSDVDRAIVESINALAHKLKAKTIAEKVETQDVLTAAREIGIDFAQGYHVSKIIPLDDILAEVTETADID